MRYRLSGRAAERIDDILLESARSWGIDAADRYYRLVLVAMDAVGDCPDLAGSRVIPRISGLRIYHLRSARRLVEIGARVGEPRHLIIYRVGLDGVVEILSLVHDRMLIARAARRARRDAEN